MIALYVIGPPRLNDLATSVTAISFLTLVGGCSACAPSWFGLIVSRSTLTDLTNKVTNRIGAAIVLFGAKPRPDSPPPHAKLLRMLCLIATARLLLFDVMETWLII